MVGKRRMRTMNLVKNRKMTRTLMKFWKIKKWGILVGLRIPIPFLPFLHEHLISDVEHLKQNGGAVAFQSSETVGSKTMACSGVLLHSDRQGLGGEAMCSDAGKTTHLE
ncbi:ABC transporter permease [Sesbania bispinosa]|nr:ABC transporter permease [Sesbania bispinosa]